MFLNFEKLLCVIGSPRYFLWKMHALICEASRKYGRSSCYDPIFCANNSYVLRQGGAAYSSKSYLVMILTNGVSQKSLITTTFYVLITDRGVDQSCCYESFVVSMHSKTFELRTKSNCRLYYKFVNETS